MEEIKFSKELIKQLEEYFKQSKLEKQTVPQWLIDVGDLVFKLGHIPSPVIIKDKAYLMTFEDNCFLATSPDNMDFTEGIEMGV